MGRDLGRLVNDTKKVAAANAEAFGPKRQRQLDQLEQRYNRQAEAVQKQSNKVSELQRKLDDLGAGGTNYSNEYFELEKVLQGINVEINKLNAARKRAIGIGDDKEVERLDQQLASLGDTAHDLDQQLEKIRFSPPDTPEAQKLINDIELATNQLERLESEAQYTADRIEDIKANADGVPGAISKSHSPAQTLLSILKGIAKVPLTAGKAFGALSRTILNVSRSIFKTTKTTNGLTGSIGNLHKRLLRLAAAALVFNQIRKGLRSLSTYLGNVMRLNAQFVSSLASVKGNLLTAFQPIYEAILPALNALAAALARVTAYLAAFVNMLFGKSAAASQAAAKSLYDQAKALDATGKAAKDAAGKLAAFDEINVLAQENADSGGGGTEVITPDFDYDLSWYEEFFDKFDSIPEAFYSLGKRIAESIANGLLSIDWAKVRDAAGTIAESIGEFINGFIDTPEFWYAIGLTIAEGINTAAYFAIRLADTVQWQELGQMIALAINTSIQNWDPSMSAEAVYKWVNGLFSMAYAVITETNWGELGAKIGTFLNESVLGIRWDEVGATLGAGVSAIISFLYEAITTFDWLALGASLATAINNWISGVDWEEAGKLFGESFNAILDMIIGFIDEFDWDNLADSVTTFINNSLKITDWKKVGIAISDGLKSALNLAKKIIVSLDWGALGKGIITALWNIDWVDLGQELLDILTLKFLTDAIMESILEWWNGKLRDAGGNVIQGLFDGLLEGLGSGGMGSWVAEYIVNPFIEYFKKLFGISSPSTVMKDFGIYLIQGLAQGVQITIQSVIDLFVGLWDTVKEITSSARENVKAIWDVVSSWFNDFVIEPVGEFFTSLWENVTEWASNAWEAIKSVWENVTGWFGDKVISPLTDAFRGFANSTLSTFESIGNGIVSVFEDAINFIINAVNSLIDKVNSISSSLPFGDKISIPNIPKVSLGRISIPKLATGAVIPPNSEFLAVLGDQKHGRNIEAPEGLIDEIVGRRIDEAMDRVVDAIENNRPVLNASGSLAELARLLFPELENVRNQRGTSLIAGQH